MVPGLHKNIPAGHRDNRPVVRHAVLCFSLWGGHLEVTAEYQFAIDDVIDGICSPGEGVVGSTSWAGTTPPFIGKQHLAAIVVEGRGVPIGEARVTHRINALRCSRVGDIKQNPVT